MKCYKYCIKCYKYLFYNVLELTTYINIFIVYYATNY